MLAILAIIITFFYQTILICLFIAKIHTLSLRRCPHTAHSISDVFMPVLGIGSISVRSPSCPSNCPDFVLSQQHLNYFAVPPLSCHCQWGCAPDVCLGGDSIDILDGLNQSLNKSLNHFSIQCLPKRVLNLVLNPSLKFSMSIELHREVSARSCTPA